MDFVLYFTKEQIVRVSGLAVKPILSSLTSTKRLPEFVSRLTSQAEGDDFQEKPLCLPHRDKRSKRVLLTRIFTLGRIRRKTSTIFKRKEDMILQEKLDLVTNYFAEDWAINKAMQLLDDYEKMVDAQQPASKARKINDK